MAKIEEYVAPQGEFAYTPQLEGINAIERATEQRRRVAQQESEIAHRTGAEIEKGLNELQVGWDKFSKVNNKANEHAETLATMKAVSDAENTNLIESQKTLTGASLLDTQAPWRAYQEGRERLVAAVSGAKGYTARKYAQEKLDAYDKRGITEAQAQVSDRSVVAFNQTWDKIHTDNIAAIEKNPAMAFEKLANIQNDLHTSVKNFPGLSPSAALKAAEEQAPKLQEDYAKAAVRGFGNADSGDPAQALEHLKDGTWDKSIVLGLGAKGVEWADTYLREQVEKKGHIGDAKISEAKRQGEAADQTHYDKWGQAVAQAGGHVTPEVLADMNKWASDPYERGGAYDHEKAREKYDAYQKQMKAEKDPNWKKDQPTLHTLFGLAGTNPDDPAVSDLALGKLVGDKLEVSDIENIKKERDQTRNIPELHDAKVNLQNLTANAFSIKFDDKFHQITGATASHMTAYTKAIDWEAQQIIKWRQAKMPTAQIQENLTPGSEWFTKVFWPKIQNMQRQSGDITPEDIPNYTMDDASPAAQAKSAATGGGASDATPKDTPMPASRAAQLKKDLDAMRSSGKGSDH